MMVKVFSSLSLLRHTLFGITLYFSMLPGQASQAIVERESYRYSCKEQLWSSKILKPGLYAGDWIKIYRLEQVLKQKQVRIRSEVDAACQPTNTNDPNNYNPSQRLSPGPQRAGQPFNAECQPLGATSNLSSSKDYKDNLLHNFHFRLDYISAFNTERKEYTLFALRAMDGFQIFCIGTSRQSTYIKPPKQGFTHNIVREYTAEPIWEFEIHEGNGMQYPITKYRMNLKNPNKPSFSVVDKWIKKR